MKSLLTICLLALSLTMKGQSSTSGYQIGDAAADFKLKNVNGKMVSLADYKTAKGFVVIFTCNTCPVAKSYEQRIIALDRKYQALGYPVIAINPNDPDAQPGESFDNMVERAKQKGYTFPYLSDPGHLVTRKFGATRTPHVFILQKTAKGNIVRYIGAIDDDTEDTDSAKTKYVENALSAIDQNREPAPATTKAIGCTIKWKKS